MSASTTAGVSFALVWTTLRTPAGKPASLNTWEMIMFVIGENSLVFMTQVFPAMIGLMTARVARTNGAFHGEIPSTTPNGSRRRVAR